MGLGAIPRILAVVAVAVGTIPSVIASSSVDERDGNCTFTAGVYTAALEGCAHVGAWVAGKNAGWAVDAGSFGPGLQSVSITYCYDFLGYMQLSNCQVVSCTNLAPCTVQRSGNFNAGGGAPDAAHMCVEAWVYKAGSLFRHAQGCAAP